jgi:hypothetical protein
VYVLSFGIVGATIFIFAIFISCKLLFTIYWIASI